MNPNKLSGVFEGSPRYSPSGISLATSPSSKRGVIGTSGVYSSPVQLVQSQVVQPSSTVQVVQTQPVQYVQQPTQLSYVQSPVKV